MKFLKAFSGEESMRQKRIRKQFYSIFTYGFLLLMRITYFDRFMCWQQDTSRKNKKVILFTIGALMILMNISIFFRNPVATDTSAASNWGIIQSMNAKQTIKATNNPRILRLAQLIDSLKVDDTRMGNDSAYRNRIEQIVFRKMENEKLLEIPEKSNNQGNNNHKLWEK